MTTRSHDLNADLHGAAPDKSPAALLLIDVINDFEFPEAEMLLRHARPAAERIAQLKASARQRGVPTIYLNDNLGRWRSDFRWTVEHCLKPTCPGREIASLLHPGPEDYFVLKPKHSGFYATTLETLLRYLGTRAVVLTGFAGDICVLFTANDAYMRDLRLFVPSDCVASNTAEKNAIALSQISEILKGDIRPSTELQWEPLLASLGSPLHLS